MTIYLNVWRKSSDNSDGMNKNLSILYERWSEIIAHIAWKVPEESSKEAYSERLMEPSRELTDRKSVV